MPSLDALLEAMLKSVSMRKSSKLFSLALTFSVEESATNAPTNMPANDADIKAVVRPISSLFVMRKADVTTFPCVSYTMAFFTLLTPFTSKKTVISFKSLFSTAYLLAFSLIFRTFTLKPFAEMYLKAMQKKSSLMLSDKGECSVEPSFVLLVSLEFRKL